MINKIDVKKNSHITDRILNTMFEYNAIKTRTFNFLKEFPNSETLSLVGIITEVEDQVVSVLIDTLTFRFTLLGKTTLTPSDLVLVGDDRVITKVGVCDTTSPDTEYKPSTGTSKVLASKHLPELTSTGGHNIV